LSDYYKKKKEKDPQADIIALNRVISSKEFKNVHLLWGEEDYLRHQLRDSLCEAMGGVKGSLSFDRFTGEKVSPERVIGMAETLPFMTERRVILVEDTGWFKNGCAEIEEYIENGVCETTTIVFCESAIDQRIRLVKTVTQNGMVSQFMRQTDETLAKWVCGKLKSSGSPISYENAAYMVDVVGNDMLALSNELEKLSAYCLDRTVQKEDIDAICTRSLEDRIFEMCDEVALGNRQKAMSLYYDLVGLRESAYKTVTLITRQFETLVRVKDLATRGRNDKEISKKTGRPEFSIYKYRKQAGRYDIHTLIRILDMCADTDMSIKTGMMDEKTALETLIVNLTRTTA